MSASLSGSASWPSSCWLPWESGFGASAESSAAAEPAWNRYLLTVACPCRVVLQRWLTPPDTGRTCFAAPGGRLDLHVHLALTPFVYSDFTQELVRRWSAALTSTNPSSSMVAGTCR